MKAERPADRVRRARERALAVCAVWLLLQNLILVATVPWREWARAGVLPAAALAIGALVAGLFWLVPLAALFERRAGETETRHAG